MIPDKVIFNLGKDMAEGVASEVYKMARKKSLGRVVKERGAAGHEVLLADEISEEIIQKVAIQCLKKCPPEMVAKIVTISEGSGIIEYGESGAKDGIFLIIDPIDGTNNNVRPWKTPSPAICVSIALGTIREALKKLYFDSVRVGVVKDIFTGSMIYATKGKGAYYAGYGKIHSSPVTELQKVVLGVDLDDKKQFDTVLKHVAPLMKATKCQRRIGSSILDMWRVATGEYDAYITISGRIKMYDIAAIKLIIEEAGGIFEERLTGGKDDFLKELLETKNPACLKECKFGVVASGNKTLHRKIKDKLKT